MLCCTKKIIGDAITIKNRSVNSSSIHLNYVVNKEKYGYILTERNEIKKDKNLEGTLHIGLVTLPEKLKESLSLFHNKYPQKRLTQDGLQLNRHVKNRGRPAHSTWSKYKAQNKGKKEERHEVKTFSLTEAVKAGLIEEEGSLGETTIESNESPSAPRRRGVTKRPKLTEYSMIRYGARESQAYVASQLPLVYGTTLRALTEIKKREPSFQPTTLLDFGSGSGMTVWAANEIWSSSIKEYQCVDASEHMNEMAEYLLRGSSDINVPLKVPNVYFKRFLPLSNQVLAYYFQALDPPLLTYDVVIASHTLSELPFRVQRMQAIKSLWRKTNKYLVIVEPGNNEGFDITLQARNFIIEGKNKEVTIEEEEFEELFSEFDIEDFQYEDEGHVFAPCPHEFTCSRTYVETRDHPCNFSQKVELSFAQRNTALKKHGYSNEKFSYLILKKGVDERSEVDKKAWSRVLQPMKKRRRHVICELCCSNGNIEKHVITKTKDPYIYNAARHCLNWGDMLPLNEAKRPMNIRIAVPPEDKRKKSPNT